MKYFCLFLLVIGLMPTADAAKPEGVVVGIENAKLVVKHPPPTADAEPSLYLRFSHRSCAKQNLSLSIEEKKGHTFITVLNELMAKDCAGPERPIQYELQVASDLDERGVYFIESPLENPAAPRV